MASLLVDVLARIPNHCRLHLTGVLGGVLEVPVPDFWNHYVTFLGELPVVSCSLSGDVIRVVVFGF